MDPDYYGFLGIDRKLAIDPAELQKRFYALSRQLHPDRFAQKPAAERLQAEESTALLNDAFRVLKDPLSRAEYILKLEGLDIGEQRTKDVPPELLEEVFELNMALEELRSGDEEARGQLEDARRKFLEMREQIDSELMGLFERYDAASDPGVLTEIRGVLNRRRYIRNLVNEVEKELAPQ